MSGYEPLNNQCSIMYFLYPFYICEFDCFFLLQSVLLGFYSMAKMKYCMIVKWKEKMFLTLKKYQQIEERIDKHYQSPLLKYRSNLAQHLLGVVMGKARNNSGSMKN